MATRFLTLLLLLLLLLLLSSKSCDLGPLPGYVTRNALDTLLPFISIIINTSLQSGQMPSQLKVVKLRPLLKKPSLDHTQFSNYRPVSNLTFISFWTSPQLSIRLITILLFLVFKSALETVGSRYYGFNFICPVACNMCPLMVGLP